MAREPRRITLDVFPRGTAQQLINGDSERLSLDIPQREIQSAQGVQLLTPRGIKVTPVHQLPEVLDPPGIFADKHRRALDDRVARSTLADSGDALIGFDGDEIGALVKDRPGPRIRVVPDSGDFHPRDLARLRSELACRKPRPRP